MFIKNFLVVFLLLGLLVSPGVVLADVTCNGTSDVLSTGATLGTLASNATVSLVVLYKPSGAGDSVGASVWTAGGIFGDSGAYMGLYRGNYSGSTERIKAYNYDGNDDVIESTYTTDAWTHIVQVHSGGNLLFYKDGVLVSSIPSGNTTDTTGTMTVCKAYSAGNFEQGTIASVDIYSVALTANQIGAIGKSQLQRVQPALPSGSWDLSTCGSGSNCNSSTFLDRSGHGVSLTATGTTGAASTYSSYPWGVE